MDQRGGGGNGRPGTAQGGRQGAPTQMPKVRHAGDPKALQGK